MREEISPRPPAEELPPPYAAYPDEAWHTPGNDQTAHSEQSEWIRMLNSSPAQAPGGTLRTAVKEVLEMLLYIVLITVVVRSAVENFKIEGSSMEPTLHSGQYIVVNKIVYFHFDLNAPLRLLPGYETLPQRVIYPFRMPERGDVVVFEYPRNLEEDYIKRVIGLPGETIEIRDGQVFVNGHRLDEDYLGGASTFCSGSNRCNYDAIVVPPGELFVMGDNRANSSDSREWDTLSLHRVIGQAWVLYYPFEDWGVIPSESYAADLELAPE